MVVVRCPYPGCLNGVLYPTGRCTVCHGRGVVYDEQGKELPCPNLECVEGKVTAEFECPLCDGLGFILVI